MDLAGMLKTELTQIKTDVNMADQVFHKTTGILCS